MSVTPAPVTPHPVIQAAKQAGRSLNLYSIIAVLVGASGAFQTFGHQFGNPGADRISGIVLQGLAALALVGQQALRNVSIDIPAAVYGGLLQVENIGTILVGASGVIVQYAAVLGPTVSVIAGTTLQGIALVASVLAKIFAVKTAPKALPAQLLRSVNTANGAVPNG